MEMSRSLRPPGGYPPASGGASRRRGAAQPTSMTELSTDHELGAAVGAHLGEPGENSRERSLHRWFEHGWRPPKLLLRILHYFSHR